MYSIYKNTIQQFKYSAPKAANHLTNPMIQVSNHTNIQPLKHLVMKPLVPVPHDSKCKTNQLFITFQKSSLSVEDVLSNNFFKYMMLIKYFLTSD